MKKNIFYLSIFSCLGLLLVFYPIVPSLAYLVLIWVRPKSSKSTNRLQKISRSLMLNKKKSVEPSKSTKLQDDSQIKKKSDESSKSPKSSNRLQKISKSLMLNKKKSVEPFKSAKINDDSQIQIILAETEASVKEEFKYKEMKNMAMIAHAIAGGIEAPLQFTLQVRIRIPLLSPFHL